MTLVNPQTSERKTIGVFAARLGRGWGPEFLAGVTEEAEARDLNVILFAGGKPTAIITPGMLQPSYGLYDIARIEKMAGVIFSGDIGYELTSTEVQSFVENYANLPVIVNALQVNGVPNLIGDNLHGMQAAMSHLMDEHAYRRIAFIRGPVNQLESEQRYFAYKLALRDHHIAYDDALVLPGDFSTESGRVAIRTLLDERNQKVDAVVAANDRMAIGAFEALQLRGIQVPGDVALCGFDDVPEARALGVPLTTVRLSHYELGRQAVDLLQRRINGETLPENIVAPVQFVARWSCGCLPESIQHISSHEPLATALTLQKRREVFIGSILRVSVCEPESPLARRLQELGLRVWEASRAASNSRVFLAALEALIMSLAPWNDDLAAWHSLVSTLRNQALADISEPGRLHAAESLFQQAHIMTAELWQRHQALQRLRLEQQEEVLQAFSTSMAPAMSLDEIGVAVERHFPSMGIERMYVMLYASMTMPQSTLVAPSDDYHMLMQYDHMGYHLPDDRPKWGTGHLIPRGKIPENRRYSAIVMPLILAQNRFGFLWIEMKSREWEVYVRIRNLVSSALLRTMLVEQRSLMQKQVEHLLQESQLREMELANATETAERTAEENARLYASEQERRKDAEALSKAARNLSTLLKMAEMPEQIFTELAGLLSFERGALIMQISNGDIQIVAHKGYPQERSHAELLGQIDSNGAFAQIVQSGEPVIIADVTMNAGWKDAGWLPLNHSWMGVPLFSKSQVIGMLTLTREPVADFSHDELLLVTTFGMQAAISLENARLYEEVMGFNELLEGMVAQRVAELNQAYNKLEKLDKNKTSFIQVTAHELRTPLTVMKGYLGMLRGIQAINENESLLQAVEGVLKGTDRLHMIVNSMLDVARLENQTITPRLGTVVVLLLLQMVQKEYRPDLVERNIELVFEEGLSSLPFLQADGELLQKALDAVIVNAIKYTPDGGKISLGGRLVTDDELGPCLEIHVSDTGIGIDPANQQVIFEKLFQLGKVELHSSGRTKFKGGGPGLGLAIATGIIKAHKGRLWVESPGHDEEKLPGSTFFIRLPLPQENL